MLLFASLCVVGLLTYGLCIAIAFVLNESRIRKPPKDAMQRFLRKIDEASHPNGYPVTARIVTIEMVDQFTVDFFNPPSEPKLKPPKMSRQGPLKLVP